MALPPRAGVQIPAAPVVLVVAAAVPASVGAAQPTKEILVVLPLEPTAVAVVVVLVLSVGRQAARTKLVTAARACLPQLVASRPREPVVEEEEAPLSRVLESGAAPTRALVVLAAAAPAVPVVYPLTGLQPAAPQCAPRMPASLAPLILVAVVVVAPLVACQSDSQIRVLVVLVLLSSVMLQAH